jgi:putative phage-type endonuclease
MAAFNMTEIKQRTSEWFEQRKGKITGSRVGAILGLSPFSKPKDVMRSMVRDYHGAESEFKGNVATNYGTANEPAATFDFEFETGLNVSETGFHVHSEFDWLGASPDGFIGEDDVIEIKCPYGKRESSDFLSYIEQPHYYAQMQIEMFCSGRKKCHFFQWSPIGTMIEFVDFSQPWIDEHLPKLKEFYDKYLEEIKNPDKHLADLVQNKDAQHLADEYNKAKAEMADAKIRMDEAKAKIIAIADGKKTNVSGLLVFKTEKKGSIAYAKAVKALMPDADLEPYRGKATEYWTVK